MQCSAARFILGFRFPLLHTQEVIGSSPVGPIFLFNELDIEHRSELRRLCHGLWHSILKPPLRQFLRLVVFQGVSRGHRRGAFEE